MSTTPEAARELLAEIEGGTDKVFVALERCRPFLAAFGSMHDRLWLSTRMLRESAREVASLSDRLARAEATIASLREQNREYGAENWRLKHGTEPQPIRLMEDKPDA